MKTIKAIEVVILAFIGWVIISILISSCGSSHKIANTAKNNTTSEIHSQNVTSSVSTASVDTLIIIPGSEFSLERPLSELMDSGVISAGDSYNSVQITYNPLTKSVKAHFNSAPRNVPVKMVTHTEVTSTESKRSKVHSDSLNKNVDVKKRSFPLWLIIVILICIGGYFVLVLNKRFI